MEQLLELSLIQKKTALLGVIRNQSNALLDAIEERDRASEQLKGHRMLLEQEKNMMLHRMHQVDLDMDSCLESQQILNETRASISLKLNKLRVEQLNPLETEIDLLRAKHQLAPLPTLEQQEQIKIQQLMEKRRLREEKADFIDIVGVSGTGSGSGTGKKKRKR